jgi:predicted glycoside hydrolase/deacetylase ChbG (UPF0249 family)
MVYWPDAEQAATQARLHSRLSVGLHLDLAEWKQLDGEWSPRYERIDMADTAAVRREVEQQLNGFRALMGRDPSHIDSHQHLHLRESVRPVVAETAHALGIPFRFESDEIRYCGSFYGQDEFGRPVWRAVSTEALIEILEQIPEGFTELCCHPGDWSDFENEYNAERVREVETLCDPRVRAAVQRLRIQLCSFRDVPSAKPVAVLQGGVRS